MCVLEREKESESVCVWLVGEKIGRKRGAARRQEPYVPVDESRSLETTQPLSPTHLLFHLFQVPSRSLSRSVLVFPLSI